ncbi:Carbonic anhydrase [Alloactinosynnema sp. L-07]|uniref:carbonic anhydrase family protein n=1 Tax=Alloactinosynnema sp. L-07 TaxID=1653480 RepID=UPI00065EF5EB|nr:carbonic anhydrase family protein [Alloactinosynnema sp. L-07]CRK54978.1 Carbonic anhydrase [Alloactinosynnema sp. L-07]CRK62239.1 Carbonic anhydrase [Alloactinosynnema sp. L-07]
MISRRLLVLAAVLALPGLVLTAGGSVAQSLPRQSPINITAAALRADWPSSPLRIDYGWTDVSLEYVSRDGDRAVRGEEETEQGMVEPGAGRVALAGVRYDLVQFHFHTPAEHRFGGLAAPMELHLVHRDATGKLLVIGVPLVVGGGGSTVDTVLRTLAPECGPAVAVGRIDLNGLLPAERSSLRYDGSLTTAPFTEGVRWVLMREKHVAAATVARFQELFADGNSRQAQPLNGRGVHIEPDVW